MKAILLSFLLCSCILAAYGQTLPVDKTTGLITYTEVVNSDSASLKQIYKAAKLWVLYAYSPGYVSQLNDDETGTIVLRPVLHVYQNDDPNMDAGSVQYTLTIKCRNGRYMYTVTDFFHLKIPKTNMCDGGPLEREKYDCEGLLMNKKALWADIKKQVNDNTLGLIADMKKSIANTLRAQKADW